MATDAKRRGITERELQAFLGHSDVRSTPRYARMSRQALIHVLRPPEGRTTCPAEGSPPRNPAKQRANMASPTGLEPAFPYRESADTLPIETGPCGAVGARP